MLKLPLECGDPFVVASQHFSAFDAELDKFGVHSVDSVGPYFKPVDLCAESFFKSHQWSLHQKVERHDAHRQTDQIDPGFTRMAPFSWHNRGFRKLHICNEIRTCVIDVFIALANAIIITRLLIAEA